MRSTQQQLQQQQQQMGSTKVLLPGTESVLTMGYWCMSRQLHFQ
jgi:hypothetical protein